MIDQSTDRLLYAIRIVEQDRVPSTSPLLGHQLSASSKKRYIPVSFLILTYPTPSDPFVLRFIPSISPFPARSTTPDGEMDQSWVLLGEAHLLLGNLLRRSQLKTGDSLRNTYKVFIRLIGMNRKKEIPYVQNSLLCRSNIHGPYINDGTGTGNR